MSSDQFKVESLDHFVLTVQEIPKSLQFYTEIMGMKKVLFGKNGERVAVEFGHQKINLHEAGNELKPHARNPQRGSGDLCFVTKNPLSAWQAHLSKNGIEIEEGPVPRTGARGPMTSIYIRDPDGNLIEIAYY